MANLIKNVMACVVFILSSQISIARASIITVDAVESGEIFAARFTGGLQGTPVDNYAHNDGLAAIGSVPIPLPAGFGFGSETTIGYAIYDLSPHNFVASGVSMGIDLNFINTGILDIRAVTSIPVGTLANLPTGFLYKNFGSSLAAGLEAGESMGTQNVTSSTILNVPLTASAVDLVNASNGRIAFAFTLTTGGPFPVESLANFGSMPRLILSRDDAVVSEPGTLWLFMLSGLFLARRVPPYRRPHGQQASAHSQLRGSIVTPAPRSTTA